MSVYTICRLLDPPRPVTNWRGEAGFSPHCRGLPECPAPPEFVVFVAFHDSRFGETKRRSYFCAAHAERFARERGFLAAFEQVRAPGASVR